MFQYNAVTPELLGELTAVLGDRYVSVDEDKLEMYKTDEETDPNYHHLPEVVVFPETTEQVAAVVRLANQYVVPITPRGAGTGVSGGAIPVCGGIVLVMDRMDRIVEFDEENLYVVAQAGVRTEEVQKQAKQRGLLYAGDPCSSDSCQIGGNVSTNAGGNKAVKYGTTRDQVYAVEVVTAQGEIVNLGSRLAKRSTGYALEQLVVGSEGTLAIVTQVTLKLKPLPTHSLDLLAIFTDLDKALRLPNRVAKAGLCPTSMEFMDNRTIRSCGRFIQVDLPYAEGDGIYVIISVDGFQEAELHQKADILDALCTECGAVEVLMADERIWKARRSVAEAARLDSLIYSAEDVVVPLDALAQVMHQLPVLEEKHGIVSTTCAHIGDGNIHVIALKGAIPDAEWAVKLEEYHKDLYQLVYKLGGRLSGEHGIGCKKVKEMEMFTDPVELQMMKTIKLALDPRGILNPGKIFRLAGQ